MDTAELMPSEVERSADVSFIFSVLLDFNFAFSSTKKNSDKRSARRPRQLRTSRVWCNSQALFVTTIREQAEQVGLAREHQVPMARQEQVGWQQRQHHSNVGTVKPIATSYAVKLGTKNSVTLIRLVLS